MQSITGQVLPVSEQISRLRNICPHATALSLGDRQMSYAELNRLADQFAAYLAERGVVPDDMVALCMERSFDWIVAALGIMRAGAAYLPLDPAWPDARLRFAVNDANATALVARTAMLDHLNPRVTGIDPARDAGAIAAARPDATALPLASPESLAYVIYTSGSTGGPKGVEITQGNLCQLVGWHREAFSVTSQDRASHLAGLGFDAAVWEIWPHLASGATLCLAADEVRLSPELLQQWLIRERVTIAFAPTVHAMSLIGMSWPKTTSLRFLLAGGDAMQRGPAAGLPFRVVNNYGPTECTVVSTSAVLEPGATGAPPIGLAIAGTVIYLLDEAGQPVKNGECGEIYVGGGGVARGYRNLPDLTRQCFLPDPFSETPAARMYRTGDIGVRRADGQVEFHGRRDRQTKIRGQRIELDEIGGALMSHPGVDFAVAVARLATNGESELVAHILPSKKTTIPSVRELQQHLLQSLPAYMIPAVFARLDKLPLSSSGKIDLKVLADENLVCRMPEERPVAGASEAASSPVPATPIEKRLLVMMREILKSNSVRPEDNFFLAGGHSLLAMQLVMRVRDAFGVDMSLRQLFEAPTVERLASLVEQALIENIRSMTDEEAERQLTA